MAKARKLDPALQSIKLKTGFRNLSVKDASLDKEKRTIQFPFSSEYPVERWFGDEVLSHTNGAPDLTRLNDGAPLLFNHDPDQIIGVVERAWLGGDKRCYAEVRFSQNPLGMQVMSDVQDGIIRNVSFGYMPKSLKLSEMDTDGDDDTYVSDDWEAFEISMVSVPADPTVGVGRSARALEVERDVPICRNLTAEAAATSRSQTMPDKTAAEIAEEKAKAVKEASATATAEATTAERARVAEILAMGEFKNLSNLAGKLVADGASIAEARLAMTAELAKNPSGESVQGVKLDLTEKEREGYSLVKAIRAQTDAMTGNANAWKEAGFERECSDAIAKTLKRTTAGFFMPVNISMSSEMREIARKRGMLSRATSGSAYAVGTAGSGTTGGTLVATNLLATEFIEVLRAKARVMQAGARLLTGLVGNVDIPRQTSATTAYWVTEGADVTEGEAAFDKVTLAAKTIGAYSQITRNMMMQSTPDIEIIVRDDLAKVLALGIDLAALSGSGSSGQPKGIVNMTNVGKVVGGTNGAAITIDHLIDLETKVMDANVEEDTFAYLCNPQTVGALKKLKSTTGQYLWNNAPGLVGMRGPTPGEINGYPVYRTKQLTATGSKGSNNNNLSTLVAGAWDQLLIGEWGVLEILPNPFGAGYASGTLEMRALQTIDIQARHQEAFSCMTDAQATLGVTYN